MNAADEDAALIIVHCRESAEHACQGKLSIQCPPHATADASPRTYRHVLDTLSFPSTTMFPCYDPTSRSLSSAVVPRTLPTRDSLDREIALDTATG